MENKLKKGSALVLKQNFPPFPIGTEFIIDYSVDGRMILKTPDFGAKLPNGEQIPSMSVKYYYEYETIFEKFGGWEEWFETKTFTEIEEWSSLCVKFKGKPITQDVIEKIKALLKSI